MELKKEFYDIIREELFNDKLTQSQVDGVNSIVKVFSDAELVNIKYLAYMLATAYHETAHTMRPIEEYGKGKGYDYGKKLKMSRKPYITPDKIYYGRGYVQLTWYENYDNLGKLLKVDLLNKPELALDPYIAGQIMLKGMLLGLFTGKKLSTYFEPGEDWVNARKIINGLDKADKIAEQAKIFYKALTK